VAVYDTQVTIYNQATGDVIQEVVKLDKGNVTKFRLKYVSINIENKQIYLVAHNIKKTDKELQTEIYFMREIPVEQ
jgi:dTDP-4-dehydrorhamnose 3,5-epimerase-like enzyme